MSLFIDSSDIDEIRDTISWGIVDGVTTNPSLIKEIVLKKGKISFKDYIVELLKTAGKERPVSLEVMSTKASGMVKEATKLYEEFNSVANNVVIKIPVTTKGIEAEGFEGVKAIKELADAGIPVNATLIMTASQAYLAAKAGAKYVSPFLGRIDDFVRTSLNISYSKGDYFNRRALRAHLEGSLANQAVATKDLKDSPWHNALNVNSGQLSGVEVLGSIKAIFKNCNFKTKILAASIRNPRQVEEAFEMGADVVTVPYEVLKAMVTHPKSEEGIRLFVEDAKKINYGELFGP